MRPSPVVPARRSGRNSVARLFLLSLGILGLLLSPPVLPAHGQTAALPGQPQNRIRNLYDAFGHQNRGTILEWGYSALIEYDGKTILFDGGSDADTLAHNAKALGANLARVDLAVLSHRHADHASGIDYLLKVNPNVPLYLPDDRALGAPEQWDFSRAADAPKIPPEDLYWGGKKTAIAYRSTGRYWHANATFVRATREVAPGITILVLRSTTMGDFSKYPPNEDTPELVGFPELSLALTTSSGTVLVVGCSHPGVENIVREAKVKLGKPIELLTGGFHLLPYPPETIRKLAVQLKDVLHVRRIGPAHCSGVPAFRIFREVFGEQFVYAGLESEIRFPS
ncbi:MAG: MBL fold metallo-hydrolase [Acidobacteriota bacterium]